MTNVDTGKRCEKESQDLANGRGTAIMKYAAAPGVAELQMDLLKTSAKEMMREGEEEATLPEKIQNTARKIAGMLKNAVPGADFPELLEPIPSFHLQLTELYSMAGHPIDAIQNALRTCFIHDPKLFKQPVNNANSMHLLTLQMTLNNMLANMENATGALPPKLQQLKALREELHVMIADRHKNLIEVARKAWGRECVVTRALEDIFRVQHGVSFEHVMDLIQQENYEAKAVRIIRIVNAEKKILEWAGLLNPLKRSFFLTGEE